jgi:UDP-glucose 4-epimerase
LKILITGGLGHIGSYLIRNLSSQVEVSEIVVVDSLQTQRFSSLFSLPITPRIKFIEKDVMALKKGDLDISEPINCVIHLAAMTDASGNIENSSALFNNNLGSTEAMAELCSEMNIPMIFPSSTSVYGSQSDLVDEACTELLPQSPYAECKLKEEELIRELTKSGLKATILRLGTIHGVSEGMRFHTAVNKFCFQTANRLPITVWKTALHQKRPYLSLLDANAAFAHIITKGIYSGELFNVLTKNHTVKEIIDAIEFATKEACEVEYVESKIMNQLSYEVSSKKIEATGLGFRGSLQNDVSETMKLLSGIRNV